MPDPRWRSRLETASIVLPIVVSMVILGFVVVDRYSPPASTPIRSIPAPPLPSEPLPLEGATILGDARARIAMIEFSDFECPFCGKFAHEIRPMLLREYVDTGKVLLAFRHLPLSNHRLAEGAAEAAECAGRQNRFWEMHTQLFIDRNRLDRPSLREHAQEVGLRMDAFDRCMSGEVTEKVRGDAESGRALSVDGTPTFFLGTIEADGHVRVTKRLKGARPVAEFRRALDELLAKDAQ